MFHIPGMCHLCSYSQSVSPNLRRSTRKRRISVNLEGFTDSSGAEDEDLMVSFVLNNKHLDNELRLYVTETEFI